MEMTMGPTKVHPMDWRMDSAMVEHLDWMKETMKAIEKVHPMDWRMDSMMAEH